ncbi:MAG: hypothetical protein AUJ51_02380 [Elusimicrobia bacterium CG1_02_56_21]|nr:MAG: hypothetical protein AUJ51_02380 [Elusimicrobia bacterium CG1_02_56_21]
MIFYINIPGTAKYPRSFAPDFPRLTIRKRSGLADLPAAAANLETRVLSSYRPNRGAAKMAILKISRHPGQKFRPVFLSLLTIIIIIFPIIVQEQAAEKSSPGAGETWPSSRVVRPRRFAASSPGSAKKAG